MCALLAKQVIQEDGIAATMSAATGGGDTFANPDGKKFFFCKNGGGGSINVTFTAADTNANSQERGRITRADRVVAVAAGVEKLIGPFAPKVFNDAAGIVAVTYSGVTTVTVAVLELGQF